MEMNLKSPVICLEGTQFEEAAGCPDRVGPESIIVCH